MTDYGPPVFLLALGVFFALKGYREGTSGYPGLEVFPSKGQQIIDSVVHEEIRLTFTNKTGAPLRVSYPKLRENSASFRVTDDAVKNIGDGYRELKFINQQGVYTDHERDIDNGKSAITGIAVMHPMDGAFYSYRPRKGLFGGPKYFRLKFDVLQDHKISPVDLVY